MPATCQNAAAAKRVLVVEDDHAICDLIRDMLETLGLETQCVNSDRAAYDILPTLPGLSGLLVDVNLGQGTTGFDVARFARQILPDLAVIYVTGQASLESFKVFGVPDSGFVAKPFSRDELVGAVRARIPAND